MNLKPTLLTLLLCAATFSAVVAQDKYEYANVTFSYGPDAAIKNIEISTPAGFEKKKIDFGSGQKSGANLGSLYAEVYLLQDQGWEVVTFTSTSDRSDTYVTAFLKRKKKN